MNTSAEAIQGIREHKPDIAVINASLGDGPVSGYMVLRELNGFKGKTKVIMMIPGCERDLVIDAFHKGARGVFCRVHSLRLLSKCIRTVHKGQVWAGNEEIEHLLAVLAQLTPLRVLKASNMPLLTRREAEVVCLLAEGRGNRDISLKLNVTEHTIRNYLSNIYEKLGISNRVELVLYTIAHEDTKSLTSAKR
jgi:DNA-binding NarL/FixJ family response regulator